jgi:hypothetical protein
MDARKSSVEARKTPMEARKTPMEARKTSVDARKTPMEARKTPMSRKKSDTVSTIHEVPVPTKFYQMLICETIQKRSRNVDTEPGSIPVLLNMH